MIKIFVSRYTITTDSNTEDEWKHIIINGYPTRYIADSHGIIRNMNSNCILKPTINIISGEDSYHLSYGNNLDVNMLRKRIIASLFIEKPSHLFDYPDTELCVFFRYKEGPRYSACNYIWSKPFRLKSYAGYNNFMQEETRYGRFTEREYVETLHRKVGPISYSYDD